MHLDPKKHTPLPDGRVRIRGAGKSLGIAVFLLIFAVFWLGISGTMWVMLLRDEGFGFPACFLSIFVLVGLAVLGGSITMFVKSALVNARIRPADLVCSRLPLRLGERFTIEYEQHVRQRCRIEYVAARLVCQEWARYRVGTDTKTVEHEVYTQNAPLLDAGELSPPQYMQGAADFEIPAEAMHSFAAPDNKVKWFVEIEASIAGWPDYQAEFPLVVSPWIAPTSAGERL